MSVQIFDFKSGINRCYIIKESWKLIIDGGAKMIFPGHGKPFPVERIKKHLSG